VDSEKIKKELIEKDEYINQRLAVEMGS